METAFSLAHLTILDQAPPAAIGVAACAGYRYAGLRLLPATPDGVAYPLMADAALLRDTLACMAATGVGVFDLEIVRLGPATDPRGFLPLFETGARLSARAVLVAGDDPDPARLCERFALLCDLGAPFGLSMDLEFMPWTTVPDLAAAVRIVGAAARPNGGILVDALHFDRSGSNPAELAALPRAWLHYVQLCDAPSGRPADTAAMIHTARAERMFPGEGGIDLDAILHPLPRDLPVSLEVPTATLARTLDPTARARRAREAAASVLARRR